MTAPDLDEFTLWRDHPVTKWIFAAIRRAQGQEQAEWLRISWEARPSDGKTSPAALIELRTRHDALGELIDNDLEDWSRMNAEPQRN